ncbi:MAG: hypothetical protein V1703_00870, partial [Candidatus Altiarchaeota archaeon]
LAYSITYLHSIILLGQLQDPTYGWSAPVIEGLQGLLISPTRGLLVYSPIFILSAIGMINVWRRKNTQMKYYSMVVILTILLWSRWWEWHACIEIGPSRYLIETLPFLCLFLAEPIEIMIKEKKLKAILTTLILISVLNNLIL